MSHSLLPRKMGNVAALFGAPPSPKHGPLPEIPGRSRNRKRKEDEADVDIPALILRTKARIERFELQYQRALRDAKAIWDDPKNRNVAHQKSKALNYMKQAKRAENQIAALTVHLANTQGAEASVSIAENQKYIAGQMRQVKTIFDKQSVDLPDINEIGELKGDLDEFQQDMADRNSEFTKLFSEQTLTSYEEMTLDEEEELMDELNNLVSPEEEDDRPPDNPGASAEKAVRVSEEDLDKLLDELPVPYNSAPKIPATSKRKVALML